MRSFLRSSITASANRNKLNGIRAEVAFRTRLAELGYGERVSQGGWIFRRNREEFGSRTIVVFPEVLNPETDYPLARPAPQIPLGLHTVCATFQQTGIHAYFCYGAVGETENVSSVKWSAIRLGVPMVQHPIGFPEDFGDAFVRRERRYNFLNNEADVSGITDASIPEQFAKENLRVTFRNHYFAEDSDVDGIFWGDQYTYPLEIKEKTVAEDDSLGEWFGIDLGPFVKLAYYAAKRGNLNSLFVVREIDDEQRRNHVEWWFVKFEELARFASWVAQGGGQNMRGGGSTVVKVPRRIFHPLTAAELRNL